MLALRRLSCAQPAAAACANGDKDASSAGMLGFEAILGDQPITSPALLRAHQLAWLTLDLAIHKDELGRTVQGEAALIVDCFTDGPLEEWVASLGRRRKQVGAELRAARRNGPLVRGVVDMADLDRQLGNMRLVVDRQSVREMEDETLGDLADLLLREGYPHLSAAIDPKPSDDDSVFVGLITSFLLNDANQFGEGLFPSDLPSLLAPDLTLRITQEAFDLETALGSPASAPVPLPSFRHDVAERIKQGLGHAQRGDYERAIIEFNVALQQSPTDAIALAHRGDAHRLKGDYERALTDYTAALAASPRNVACHVNRGTAFRLLGQYEAATNDFTEAIRLDPANSAARLQRGGVHAQLNRYDDAIADFSEAIRLDPAHPWAYQSRADAYAGKGAHDLALADYSQALRLNPYFPLAYCNRGDVYRQKSEFDRAIADYAEANRLDPSNPRVYTSRGDAYRRMQRYDQALVDFGEAIRLDPVNPAVYLNRGITYQLAGDYERAVADFDRAEQFDSANPELYYQRALAHQQKASYEQALEDLGRAIKLNPRDALAHLSRGNVHALRRYSAKAIDDFSEAIRLDPQSPQAFLARGRVLAQQHEYNPALTDCASAIQLDPQLVPAWLIRGGCQLRLGRLAMAVEEFNEAIRINPRYAKAYNDRGAALIKMGKLEDAVEDFSRAIRLKPNYTPALSNRANAYQLLRKPDLALRDFSQAVVLDSKYAASYCTQRGLLEITQLNFERAVADCTIALLLDSRNSQARAVRAEAMRLRDEHFDLNAAPAPPAVVAHSVVNAGAVTVTSDSTDAELTSLPQGKSLAATQLAFPADSDLQIEIKAPVESEQPSEAVVEFEVFTAAVENEPGAQTSDELEAQAEAQREAAAQAARIQALHQTLEIRRIQDVEEKARKLQEKNAAVARKNKKRFEDPDERAERRKKTRNYAIIAVGALFIGYWGVQLVSAMIPPPKNPFKTYTADKFLAEYAKDKMAADDKFAGKRISISGKIKLVVEADPTLKPRIYFDVPNQKEDFKIEIRLNSEGGEIERGLEDATEYRFNGVVQRLKAGSGIILDDGNLMPLK